MTRRELKSYLWTLCESALSVARAAEAQALSSGLDRVPAENAGYRDAPTRTDPRLVELRRQVRNLEEQMKRLRL